jgi:hypothetical protein
VRLIFVDCSYRFDLIRVAPNLLNFLLSKYNLPIAKTMTARNFAAPSPSPKSLTRHAYFFCDFSRLDVPDASNFSRHSSILARKQMRTAFTDGKVLLICLSTSIRSLIVSQRNAT